MIHPTIATVVSAALAAVVFTLSPGCMTPGPYDAARVGPFFSPVNQAGESSLGGIRRIVLLPIAGGSLASSEVASALDPVFAGALQLEHRFEIVPLSREECLRRFRAEAVSSVASLPADFLTTLGRDFNAEAVLFVDLTVYRAYRPLALGLRAKLAAIDGGRLIWSFDNVFSADDPAVANAARHYFLGADRSGVPADLTPAVLQSPTRFATYAASAMFATLPPVNPPPVERSHGGASAH
ncbi:MAG: hypothetical protein ABIZ49_08070 [Opitutaceae bacterium]